MKAGVDLTAAFGGHAVGRDDRKQERWVM